MIFMAVKWSKMFHEVILYLAWIIMKFHKSQNTIAAVNLLTKLVFEKKEIVPKCGVVDGALVNDNWLPSLMRI